MNLALKKMGRKWGVMLTMAAMPLVMSSISMNAYAQSMTQKVDLNSATVFLRGAELFSSGKVNLPAGESEVVFSNVAGQMNEQSLSISADNGVMVLSRTLRRDFLVDDGLSPKAQEIKDQLEEMGLRQETYQIQLSVVDEQLAVLRENRKLVQGDGSISAAELEKMLNLVEQRMTAVLEHRAQINLDVKKLNEEIYKLQQQFNEERNKGYQPGGQVVVKFYAPQATTSNVRMSYVVNDAGWVPAYDLNVTKVGDPVQLTYKANVFQNTGIDWTKVRLTLSTGNPSQGVQMPIMYPWQLSVIVPVPAAPAVAGGYADYKMASEVSAVMAPAPMAEMAIEQDMRRDRVQSNTLDGYVTTNAQGINTAFDIAIPYTVPSDGKGHMILIQNAKVAADYRYVTTPKMDSDVFLQARVTEWEGLNILPGQTNIYFENSFIGQGRVDLRQIKEGLDLSLGRDKRVIVERVEDENNKGTAGFFGGSAQRTYGYTIKLHNTRPDAVKLEILDQIPVSRDSKITLNDLKLAGGVHDKNTGEVKWTIDLQPGEKRNITYSFAVQYPKDADIAGL